MMMMMMIRMTSRTIERKKLVLAGYKNDTWWRLKKMGSGISYA